MYNLYSWNTKYPTYCIANTNNSVKPTPDIIERINAKQDKLVSGENIKTINGQPILGSGNIQISGGGTDPVTPVSVTRLPNGTFCINF